MSRVASPFEAVSPRCHGRVGARQPVAVERSRGRSIDGTSSNTVRMSSGACIRQLAAEQHCRRALAPSPARRRRAPGGSPPAPACAAPRDVLARRRERPLDRLELVALEPREALEVLHHVAIVGVQPELVERGRATCARRRATPRRLRSCRTSRRWPWSAAARPGRARCAPRTFRTSSQPAVMLPHWSLPPICSVQRSRSCSTRIVVGLQQLVAELGETDAVVALEAALHRFLRHHVVDGEVLADVAQEVEEADRPQPVDVVATSARRSTTPGEVEKALELAADALRRFLPPARGSAGCAPGSCRSDRRSARCRRRPARSARCPWRCSRASPMTVSSEPTCRLAAVGSKPM